MSKKQFYIITSVLFFLVAKVIITHKSRVAKKNHKSNVRIA